MTVPTGPPGDARPPADAVPGYGTPDPAPRATPTPVRRGRIPGFSPDEAEGAAYVVTADLRTVGVKLLSTLLGLAAILVGAVRPSWVAIGLGVLFQLPLYLHYRDGKRGVRYFAVDGAGVYLGMALNRYGASGGTVLVPWDDVTSVVFFEYVEVSATSEDSTELRRPTIGVTTMAAETTPVADEFVHHAQRLGDWSIERERVEAAVRHYDPEVPILEGPEITVERLHEILGAAEEALAPPG